MVVVILPIPASCPSYHLFGEPQKSNHLPRTIRFEYRIASKTKLHSMIIIYQQCGKLPFADEFRELSEEAECIVRGTLHVNRRWQVLHFAEINLKLIFFLMLACLSHLSFKGVRNSSIKLVHVPSQINRFALWDSLAW